MRCLPGCLLDLDLGQQEMQQGEEVEQGEMEEEDKSTMPARRDSVSSSTPLRVSNKASPHPLESVEATPIRAPDTEMEILSPQPMMVTGGLAKMLPNRCSIM